MVFQVKSNKTHCYLLYLLRIGKVLMMTHCRGQSQQLGGWLDARNIQPFHTEVIE